MPKLSLGLVSAWAMVGILLLSTLATAQPAPTSTYTSIDVVQAKPVQIGYHASANKANCTPGPSPTIRVVESPRAGSLMVRGSELTTNKLAGCPPFKIPAQVLIYTARRGDADTDRFIYEVTNANGEVATYQITVNIKPVPAPTPKAAPNRDQKF